jgi:hypothetical protein
VLREDYVMNTGSHGPATEPSTVVLRYHKLTACSSILGVDDWYPGALRIMSVSLRTSSRVDGAPCMKSLPHESPSAASRP